MKFRQKPVVIEAFQLTEESRRDCRDWPEWMCAAWNKNTGEHGALYCKIGAPKSLLFITTLTGIMQFNVGDWVIRGVAGDLYSCKPDVFAQSYEPV